MRPDESEFFRIRDVKDMTPEEVDLQYSPSRWSKLFTGSPAAVVQHHVDVTTAGRSEVKNNGQIGVTGREREIDSTSITFNIIGSNAAKEVVPHEAGIQYGTSDNERLDIFGGDVLPNDAPILVHFHGGYWQALGRDMASYIVPPLFRRGIRVIVVGYDLCPTVTVAQINGQVETAAAYIFKYATKIGAKSISFSGHSAGGQIVAALFNSKVIQTLTDAQRRLIKCSLLISGVYDLTLLLGTHVNDPLKLNSEDAYKASPMFYEREEVTDIKVLAIIAEYDTPEYKRQSIDYAKKLSLLNKQVEVFTVPQVDHFELVEELMKDDYILTKKMAEYILS